MLRVARAHLTYANVIATIALFVALGGGAYAAFELPAKSVGTRELKNGAVTKGKIDRRTLRALAGKRGPTGRTGAAGATGTAGQAGPPGATGAVGGALPSGATLVGAYSADAQSATSHALPSTEVSFGYRVAGSLTVAIVPKGTTPPSHCPGTPANPKAAPGYFCIFETYGSSPSYITVQNPETTYGSVGHTGVEIYTSNGSWSMGTWALTAP